MKDITVEELVQSKQYIPVDVRSPIEYREAAIPGSVNIPLFSNEEREKIGILYKNKGTEAAKWKAMEIVSPKLPTILNRIKEIEKNGMKPVIHCWRGGSRSKSIATFLELAGSPAIRLEGGYRAYREYILEKLPKLLPRKAVVLHGHTGTGKTAILKILHEKGFPVLDLEGLANHRGSLFGSIGIGDSYNQKTFDALLFSRLKEIKGSEFFIMEAESKRIGRASQPDDLIQRKINGIHILVHCTFENRVERIYREYVLPYMEEEWFHGEIVERVGKIKKRLKNPTFIAAIENATMNRQYKDVIAILMEHYYDPRYSHSLKDYPGHFIQIDGDESKQAAYAVAKEIKQLFVNQ